MDQTGNDAFGVFSNVRGISPYKLQKATEVEVTAEANIGRDEESDSIVASVRFKVAGTTIEVVYSEALNRVSLKHGNHIIEHLTSAEDVVRLIIKVAKKE